ncbi:MAG: DedA family protein [Candidatus Pacearchaeota archaeon]|jgi:membrane protein DedA with SNARE-associated domain
MVLNFISQLVNAILIFVNSLGYLGIFIGMAIESSIIPLPSELILIPAGALVAQGQMNFFLVFTAGVLGSIVGSLLCYAIAFFLGRKTFDFLVDKYGSFIFINKSHLEMTENYFKNYGGITIFTSRLLPVIRHLISLPAGFSKMNIFKFISYTAIGAGVYTAFLIIVGYFFGSAVPSFLKIVTAVILILAFIIFLAYYINKSRKKSYKK